MDSAGKKWVLNPKINKRQKMPKSLEVPTLHDKYIKEAKQYVEKHFKNDSRMVRYPTSHQKYTEL